MAIKVFSVIVVFAATIGNIGIGGQSVPTGNCPPGWRDFSGKCILYSRRPYTYSQAASFCQSVGGKLYEPRVSSREAFIRRWAVSQGPAPGTIFGPWIGINDIRSEGNFQYFTGGNIVLRRFSTGQPDNYGRNEDCVHLLNPRDRTGSWNDWQCNQKLGALCERSPQPPCKICGILRRILSVYC